MKHTLLAVCLAAILACSTSSNPPKVVPPDTPPPPPSPTLTFEPIPLEGNPALVTEFDFLPGSMEFFAAEKNGVIYHYHLSQGKTDLLGQFQLTGLLDELDCGVLALAFDPDFETNHFFYVGLCESLTTNKIVRYQFDASNYDGIDATAADIVSAGYSQASKPFHNIGSNGFTPEGYLWAAFGDKTGKTTAQDKSNNLGTLIRIIPNREPLGEGHEPAPDNPFVGQEGLSPDIYAYGLRSPWKVVLDKNGRYWVGDVGADAFEEIDLITEPAQNFGWPQEEGFCQANCEELTDPLTVWGHDDDDDYIADDEDAVPTAARVAWVGVEYRDEGADPYQGHLTGRTLFGDYCLGFIRLAEVDASGTLVYDQHVGHLPLASAWRQATDGYVYTMTFGLCETKKIPDPLPTSQLYRVVLK